MLRCDSLDFDFYKQNKDVSYLKMKYHDFIYKILEARDDYVTYQQLSEILDKVYSNLLYINAVLEEKSHSINTFKGGYNK